MATPKDKPLVEIRDTGEKAEKNGYPTRKHQLLINGRLSQEMWVTPWDEVEGGEEAIEAFQAMSEFFQKLQDSMPSFAQSGNSDGDFFEHMKSMDGFPVVTVSFGMSGQIEDINVLKSSQKASLPDSEFAPPAGYRREQMPVL